LKEINKENVMGSSGIIAYSFGNLISELWHSKEKFIKPQEFRNIMEYIKP